VTSCVGGGWGGEKKGDHKRIKKKFWDGGIKESKIFFWDVAKKLAKKGEGSEGLHCDFYRLRLRHGKPGCITAKVCW
jgi:hypothetical protein